MSYMNKPKLIEEIKKIDPNLALNDLSRPSLLSLYNDLTRETSISQTLDAVEVDPKDVSSTLVMPSDITEVHWTDTPDNTVLKSTTEKEVPCITDPNWTEYILSLMTEDEKPKGHPTCDGLRRIFQKVFGDIYSCEMKIIQSPDIRNENRSTVQCTLQYKPFKGGYGRIISDVADCDKINTTFPYNLFPSATAATMAEGRVLRKAMNLRIIANEELQLPDSDTLKINQEVMNNSSIMTDNQKNTINKMCQKFNIDVNKLLDLLKSDLSSTVLESLNYNDALVVLRKINDYNKSPDNKGYQAIPETLFKE